ncbi:MAG: accessory factor UbiK family protein [Rhizobiales bacterium]|nr:accessory factor UbiK family protein [Hyphomicrobiales bacterium]
MVQTRNRLFDEMSRLMNDAAGVAQGARREVETVIRTQAERILRDLDLVKREEFEAVKDMARLAREENEALAARLARLEAAQGIEPPAAQPATGDRPAYGTESAAGGQENRHGRPARRRAPPFL